MRLRSILLQNFKSFKDKTTVLLGQITCLIGLNGAGKPNALHGLKTIAVAITRNDYEPAPGNYLFDTGLGAGFTGRTNLFYPDMSSDCRPAAPDALDLKQLAKTVDGLERVVAEREACSRRRAP